MISTLETYAVYGFFFSLLNSPRHNVFYLLNDTYYIDKFLNDVDDSYNLLFLFDIISTFIGTFLCLWFGNSGLLTNLSLLVFNN